MEMSFKEVDMRNLSPLLFVIQRLRVFLSINLSVVVISFLFWRHRFWDDRLKAFRLRFSKTM